MAARKQKARKSFARMQLVDNFDQLHKSLVMIASVGGTLVNAVLAGWSVLEGQAVIPPAVWASVNAVLLALIPVFRSIKQPTLHQNS